MTMTKGHCSQCHKVWVLDAKKGLCQWCGKLAVCESQRIQAERSFKSKPKRKKEIPNHNGNGYNELQGTWATYYKVASKLSPKAKAEDREDLLHDILLTFADVERNNGHKPFTEATMYRIASHKVADYWREQYKRNFGLDCWHCSKAQRQKCKDDYLYPQCPKAIKLESLSKPITDSEGNITEFGELIADDKAIDLAEWIDIKTFLAGCPQRLIEIAQKVTQGESLDTKDRKYLSRYRQKEQTNFFEYVTT